jgi:hypothetical protein
MFNRKKEPSKIEFYSWSNEAEQLTEMTVPSKSHISEMWKSKNRYIEENKLVLHGQPGKPGAVPNLGLKHCIPYFDAMTAGYIQLLHCDIQVKQVDGRPELRWRSHLSPCQIRAKEEIDPKAGYSDAHFAWLMYWGIKTPEGWSSLITNPMNRPELPFTVTSGFMDTDKYHSPGNITFHIQEGFEGVIPQGTPMYQIIPVKREAWISEKNLSLRLEGQNDQMRKMNVFSGYYKKNRWQKKEYS